MPFNPLLTDDAILEEIGKRLTQRRLSYDLTQAQLAKEAGISKRTLERMEAGSTSQLNNLIRVLRALDLIEGLEQLLPEEGPSPLQLLKLKGEERKRASSRKKEDKERDDWQWGDDS